MRVKNILLDLFCFNKVIYKVKIDEILLLFVHLQTCFPNRTKVWLLNIAWQLRLNIVDCTCFDIFAILNVMKIWHIGNSVQTCFPSCWVIINFLVLVIWKVLVIKYIGKFQCLRTCIYKKCQNNPTDSSWLCQVEFLSLTQEFFLFPCLQRTLCSTVLQRYQQNNRTVTASWMLVLYSLVKTDIRASWKNGTAVTYLKILKLFTWAMEKKPPNSVYFYVISLCKKLESEPLISHPDISLIYFQLEKLSYFNLNLFLSKFFLQLPALIRENY